MITLTLALICATQFLHSQWITHFDRVDVLIDILRDTGHIVHRVCTQRKYYFATRVIFLRLHCYERRFLQSRKEYAKCPYNFIQRSPNKRQCFETAESKPVNIIGSSVFGQLVWTNNDLFYPSHENNSYFYYSSIFLIRIASFLIQLIILIVGDNAIHTSGNHHENC